MVRKLSAELLGSFFLVLLGCGSALLAAGIPEVGIGFVGVALAFGLAMAALNQALGPISGGHFNPAVSLGLHLSGRLGWRDLLFYWLAQFVGAVTGAAVLYLVASGATGFSPGGFASNGYDVLSPGGYSMLSALLAETVLTAFFVLVFLGATSRPERTVLAPLAIGFGLAAVHLVLIPVTNASANPARSLATALFAQNGALAQVWLFILAPLLGGALGGVIWRYVLAAGSEPEA